MSKEQLKILQATLRQGGLSLAGSPNQVRSEFEEMLANVPVAPDIAFEQGTLGGVPALFGRPGATGERTLLYLHGGGYVCGSAHGYRSLWSTLAATAEAHGVAIDYRLAPEHPFPAAVDDALAAYRALLETVRSPESIVVAGDSAGGGLVVSLALAAREAGLPLPSALVCFSPWVDLACAQPSMTEKADEDLSLNADEQVELGLRYAGPDNLNAPFASPLFADLKGLPPLLVQVGSTEILLDDAVGLVRRAGACGVAATLQIWPGMPHVWQLFAFMLSEGSDALLAAGGFLAGHSSR